MGKAPRLVVAALGALVTVAAAACGPNSAAAVGKPGTIEVVAAENQYGSVASQIGGQYVHVVSVLDNPSTDPHSFEPSPSVAREVTGAAIDIQNGVGYDTFMDRIESASPRAKRDVIDVQKLLGLPDKTPNPHLWYRPTTMPAVASALADDLSKLQPAHSSYFRTNLATFVKSLGPWLAALAQFKQEHPGTTAATTEPVADYMLQAAGVKDLTPFSFQAAMMNGVDPTPQDVSLVTNLLRERKVDVLVYNRQVTDPLTQRLLADAEQAGVPVVAVYETMPVPGYNYQSWMLAEVDALSRAVVHKASTTKL